MPTWPPRTKRKRSKSLAVDKPGEAVLRRFVDAVKRERPHDPETLRALAGAFEQVLSGQNPKAALRLQRRRGVKPPTVRVVLYRVLLVWKVIRLMNTRRLTKDAAIEAVSREARLSFTTLSHYYRAYTDTAYRLIELETKLSEQFRDLNAKCSESARQIRQLQAAALVEANRFARLLDPHLRDLNAKLRTLFQVKVPAQFIGEVGRADEAIRRLNPLE